LPYNNLYRSPGSQNSNTDISNIRTPVHKTHTHTDLIRCTPHPPGPLRATVVGSICTFF